MGGGGQSRGGRRAVEARAGGQQGEAALEQAGDEGVLRAGEV